MKVSSGNTDKEQSFLLLYPETNEEMAHLEIAFIRYNQTDEPISLKKDISAKQSVLAYKLLIGRAKR